MRNNKTVQQERQRKALLLLPVVAIPILCCSFYALGGGQRPTRASGSQTEQDHFNAQLPDAHFNKRDALVDKLGFYEKADEDSVKRAERMRADPYQAKDLKSPVAMVGGDVGMDKFKVGMAAPFRHDTTAERLLAKLDRLKRIVDFPAATGHTDTLAVGAEVSNSATAQISRLAGMMKTIQNSSAQDPQLEKLNGMLDKIIKIQHPEMGQHQVSISDSAGSGTAVLEASHFDSGSVYDADSLERAAGLPAAEITGFQDIDTDRPVANKAEIVIHGVIPDDQTAVTGATLKLRTQEEASIGGVDIPKNTLLYGRVSISGERMLVSIGSVRVGTGIYPVDLQVFDMDGMAGIRIPGAINRDVAKESADQGVSSMGVLGSVDESLGAQAATAGVQAAKTLFTRKVKLVRAEVRAGYPVLIKNVKIK